mmetsp:Transcript_20768/g.46475  ORF Transcript_20768/g.46475 Transcript_20768/m.46475 type:complete len:379 (-) Transcript_20768:1729-2865(-)|eukprot:CAMPEP_0181194636 /NCGR_PEP_ID=MMETSP1096-20121128/14447_1 /TAXON_ID=156174 ORGANISM="Chrysochromulina ericina, Strain CCMP281" /NCGR_SAMPLE_ID=MMETSP1096 /ASSEMBLY_ACC=CAM_ASM_000453 /LENGTH=378 /DNA_ID=CAMNT_0023284161 /DNA_START=49 /DNA_END=1185 /DNA_ORIENTATION=+
MADDAKQPKPFLAKLYKMVDEEETSNIISWTVPGDALVIHDVEAFVSQLLPQYFKHSNLSSFVRQLNTYGFSKMGPDGWVFAHAHFLRGDTEGLHLIQRKSSHRSASHALTSAADDVASEAADSVRHREDDGFSGAGEMPSGEPNDEEMRRELMAIRSHHATMASRIAELSDQINQSRAQQADTQGSIAKIMTFLSQVYSASQSNIEDPFLKSLIETGRSKRRRLEDHSTTELDAEMDGPIGEPFSSGPSDPPPAPPVVSRADSLVQAIEEIPSRDAFPSSIPFGDDMGAPIKRVPSLGQQAAMSLTKDMQEVALQLMESTELQDQCLKEVKEGLPLVSRGASGASQASSADLEHFLWDFLEASQDSVEGGQHDSQRA